MATVTAQPAEMEQGGRIFLSLEPALGREDDVAKPDVTTKWSVVSTKDRSKVEGLTITQSLPPQAYWDVPRDQALGTYEVKGAFWATKGKSLDEGTTLVTVAERPDPDSRGAGVQVHIGRTVAESSPDQPLWSAIRASTSQISYGAYAYWMDQLMCGWGRPRDPRAPRREQEGLALPFPGVDAYRLFKASTEIFLIVNCGVLTTSGNANMSRLFGGVDLGQERERYGGQEPSGERFRIAIMDRWKEYIAEDPERPRPAVAKELLPYLDVIRQKLGDQGIGMNDGFGVECYGILRDKLTYPFLLELIWSYWHEEGMLVHSMDAVARRFQNLRGPSERDPLAHVEIDPLRPLNQLLWGYVQDEQHRLTAVRRAYEYDHHYGMRLLPPTVPPLRSAESRPRFLEAFHTLLNLASAFFREDDDTTVIADGFPVLNALKDVHLLLTEGQHNQYGDLPWTARQEMLMQQWLMARPEMREFLPGRTMVAYPEPWMDRVDTMKRLQGWTPDTVIHFSNLGQFGEQILLSARFGNWNSVNDRNQAASWVRYWRTEIQGYLHAYRAVTGVDLTAERADARIDATLPALHIRRRWAEQTDRRAAMESTTASPALGYRTAPRLQQPRPAVQLPPEQRPMGWQPAQLPPAQRGKPRPHRADGR